MRRAFALAGLILLPFQAAAAQPANLESIGSFDDLSEGSEIVAEHAGRNHRWTLRFRGVARAQSLTEAKRIEQGYDKETVIKTDSVPSGMPIDYRWRETEKRLYPIPPRSRIPRIHDPKAPTWANHFFQLRKLYGELVYLYMDIWDDGKTLSLPTPMGPGVKPGSAQNSWQASGWLDYCLLTGDPKVRARIQYLADMMQRVWTTGSNFKAGYWKRADIDHGAEDIGFTTGRWWMLQPSEPKLTFSAEAFARLAGNWGPADLPQWYDWEKHRWKAYFMGSEFMGETTYNTTEDNRVVGLVLLAYAATSDQRYLKLATDFLDAYLTRLDQLGEAEPYLKKYRDGLIYNHKDPRMHHFTDVRYHFVMSSMANPLMDVFRITGDRKYLDAARRFLQPAMPDLLYCWSGNKESSALAGYRHLSGDRFADAMVLDWVNRTSDFPDDLFAYFWRPLGNEDTNWDWMHMHWIRTHPAPTTFRLAYDISGDERYLNWALEGAINRASILYAQQSRPETRHGRDSTTSTIYTNDWDWRLYVLAYEIVDVLFPMVGRHPSASGEGSDAMSGYDVRFFHENGAMGVPDTIAINYRRTSPVRRLVEFYNAAERSETILVEPHDFLHSKVVLARGQGAMAEIVGKRVKLVVPARSKATVDIALEK